MRGGPTALDAFLRARKRFLARERIDMSGLAEELGVSRVTLYRWVGSREQLLVDVIWSLGRRTLDNIEAEVTATGYLDLITGEQPDARRAEPILRLLLRD